MKKDGITYLILTIIIIFLSILLLRYTNLDNSVALSKSIEIIIILFLVRIMYGCTLYIKRQFSIHKYSYSIIMNVGLLIFLFINILRHLNLLIFNWNVFSISDIYNNTIRSFSYFAMLTLPCIIILSIYAIITNIVLIKKEGFKTRNLLGIFLGFFALIGLFGSQGIYIITSKLFVSEQQIIFKRFIDVFINATLSYFYTLIIATLYCNVIASKHIPEYNQDFIIILGSKIREDGTLTPLLKGRADKAIEFGRNQLENTKKQIYYIPSGGKGNDEIISEAQAIKNYLLEQGIDKKFILVEDKSTSTIENMKYSNEIIQKEMKDAKVSFSTTNYHVFRSGVIAAKCGIDCEGMGSNTKWYFYTNALIREFIANLVQEKKRHIGLILVINISTLILILIGYYYHLIAFVD